MKKDIHPDYREIVFQDVSAGVQFLMKSTARTNDKIMYEGKEYPLVKVSISSASHPFFTGKQKFVDTAGRIEKFQKRYQIDGGKGTGAVINRPSKKKGAAGAAAPAAETAEAGA